MRKIITNMGRRAKSFILKPEIILRYLTKEDDKLDTLITCSGGKINLATSDHGLYEALGSIKKSDKFNLRKLIKFLEVVDVVSIRKELRRKKPILTEERVKEIRKLAKQGDEYGKKG